MNASRPRGACRPHPLPSPVRADFLRRPEGAAVLLLVPVLDHVERVLVAAYPHLAEPDDTPRPLRNPDTACAIEDLIHLIQALRDTVGRYHDACQRAQRPSRWRP